MRSFFAAIVLCALAAMFLGHAALAATGQLQLAGSSGDAPFTAEITGPASMLANIAACRASPDNLTLPVYRIAWGDGQTSPPAFDPMVAAQRCPDHLQHRYTVPGTYIVRAELLFARPMEAPLFGDVLTSTVVVGGTAHADMSFTLEKLAADTTFRYRDVPPIRWTLETASPVDIKVDILSNDGTPVYSGTSLAQAFSGAGETVMAPLTGYDAALRANAGPYRVRAVVQRGEQVLATQMAGPVMLTAQLPVTVHCHTVDVRDGIAALRYPFLRGTCFSYSVDWGDGSAPERRVRPATAHCNISPGALELKHAYKPGKYRITVRSNDADLSQKLDDVLTYEATDLTVE